MAKLVTLKHRISSVKSTRQITRAMQLVAASKLRRAQEQARASRDYREIAYALLSRLMTSSELQRQPLFRKRPVRSKLYVVLTSNTGLAGAYNANVLKRFIANVKTDQTEQLVTHAIMVGSKGAQLARHLDAVDMLAYYPAFGDHPSQVDVQPLLRDVITNYATDKVDEVHLLYTYAASSIRQEVIDLPLLPAQLPTSDAVQIAAMNYEPDAETVVTQVATRLVEVQLWQAVLEALAAEQLSRMLAMKNATDNATELIVDYTLEYQTVRQAAITQEIAEISGGAEAMKD